MQLAAEQVEGLERFSPEFCERHIEAHGGDPPGVDTFLACAKRSRGSATLKVVGKIYLQSAIDCCSRRYGREFCGRPDRLPYELFRQLEGFEHRKTRVKRPQSNGIVERFHRSLADEHFRVEGRRTWFETVEEMQIALEAHRITDNT